MRQKDAVNTESKFQNQAAEGKPSTNPKACPMAIQARARSNPKSHRKRAWRMEHPRELPIKNGQRRKNTHTQTNIGFTQNGKPNLEDYVL